MARRSKKPASADAQNPPDLPIDGEMSIQEMQPERLLTGYGRSSVFMIALVVALVAHFVLIIGTSPATIREYLNPGSTVEPEEVTEQRDAAVKVDAEAAADADKVEASKNQPAETAGEGDGEAKAGDGDGDAAGDGQGEAWKDTAIGRQMTEKAGTDELPTNDDMFGETFGGDGNNAGE